MLYQLLCFGIYIAVIPPIFKNGGFKRAQKIFKKEGLPAFKNAKQMLTYHRLAYMAPEERILDKNKKLLEIVGDVKNPKDGVKLIEYLVGKDGKGGIHKKTMENQGLMFELAKGSIELSSIIGSVVGLTILAPEISHLILHPIMNALHLKPEKENTSEADKAQKIIDKNA